MKTLALSMLVPALVLVHLLVAPHTKVEESFALQATHDLLAYGVPSRLGHASWAAAGARLRATFDHFAFPGAVPRSFAGPLLLAAAARPLVALGGPAHAQTAVRAVLGTASAAALLAFAAALRHAAGRGPARWWLVLLCSQFHVLFYASRTLGNVFAFALTTVAFALLLPPPQPDAAAALSRQRQALALLAFAAVVFRAELALLLAAVAAHLLATRRATLRGVVVPVVAATTVAVAVTVPIDSFLWQRPVWPELAAFHYNAVLGRAADWGVAPWHFYFSSALPRLLLNPLALPLLVPLALALPATARLARGLAVPPLLFMAAYSAQPHKELRFVLYVVPPLTAAAALAADYVFTRRAKSPAFRLAAAALVASVLASTAAAVAMLLLSALNYPGGDALAQLPALIAASHRARPSAVAAVHADVLSCMSGVTLFGPRAAVPPLSVDKTEDAAVLADPDFWARFDYILSERADPPPAGRWRMLATVQAYAGLQLLRPGQPSAPPLVAAADGLPVPVVGQGALVAALADRVRPYTLGWWLGPRMHTRIHIFGRQEDRAAAEQEDIVS